MSPFPTRANPPPRPGDAERQEPLGPQPSYDDVLDVAVQYTFPASDPIAVQSSVRHPEREEGHPKGPGATPGHGESVDR